MNEQPEKVNRLADLLARCEAIGPLCRWLILVVVATALLYFTGPAPVESPYNGF